jgi:hypothetical protein
MDITCGAMPVGYCALLNGFIPIRNGVENKAARIRRRRQYVLVRQGAEDEVNTIIGSSADRNHSFTRLNRKAFVITDTELKLIAAAAMIGDSNKPKNGYSNPAAIGTPSML